ncbi:MAG TPA: hypothetical protein PKZ40_04815, partial [Anaerolineaceae bacterium]|nr:hypothetical protein [Anaerolineaceae bacterium]
MKNEDDIIAVRSQSSLLELTIISKTHLLLWVPPVPVRNPSQAGHYCSDRLPRCFEKKRSIAR